jgi:hypothetical protein
MKRKEELKARLEKVENKRFFLAMKDRWNANDSKYDDDLLREEIALKKELANL